MEPTCTAQQCGDGSHSTGDQDGRPSCVHGQDTARAQTKDLFLRIHELA